MSGSFVSEWLTSASGARAFVGLGVRSEEARRQAVREAARRTISPALAGSLRAVDDMLPPSRARRAHLDALAKGGVAAIVTGQQTGLFLGPLFTFYKAASAIVLARALEAESGVRCVPVFWLQSEDHDFVEINHCHLPGPVRLALPDDNLRISVAHRLLGDAVLQPLGQLEAELGTLPYAAELLHLVREHYRPERSLVGAFAGLLAAIFSDEGLVFLDPRRPEVAPLTAPLLRRAITECDAIDGRLADRGRALAEAGFAEQVHVRAGSPLCFFHDREPSGPRHRLARTGHGWALAGPATLVTDDQLANAAPLRFSSSALIRPIVQDALLPTAAYVGGPAELAYFAQLAPLYQHFEISPPAFALRARLRCIEPSTRALLDRLGLPPDAAEQPREALLAKVSRPGLPSPEALRSRLLDGALRGIDELTALAPSLDPNLQRPIDRTRGTVERAIARLVDRYGRARIEHDRVAVARVDRLQAQLFPEGMPQERFYGLLTFVARSGVEAFKAKVLAAIDPFDPAIRNFQT